MPQGFSFEGDIAPMRGSFFKSGLSSREGSYLAKKYGPDTKDMKDMLTIQSQLASIRNSDLAYERNLHALQTAKEEYKNERDTYNKLPSLMEDVTKIKNNPELDPYAKQEEYNSLALRYPHLLTTNKVADTMVTGAMASNDVSIKRIADQERRDYRDISLLQSAPDAQAAAEIAQRGGMSPVEGTMVLGRYRREQTAITKAEQAAEKEAKKNVTSHLDDQLGQLGKMQDALTGIKPVSAEDQMKEWMANAPQRDTNKAAYKAYEKSRPEFTPTLSDIDTERVKAHAITLGLHNSIDIERMDPMELRKAVYTASNQRAQEIKQIRGFSASPKTTTSSAGSGFKTR
jgi:hypothetical protein